MKKTKTLTSVLLLTALVVLMTAGCSSQTAANGPTELIIGAGNAYKPYWYLDDNEELTGFEKAILDEIDARLTDYTFTYQQMDFANILLSLESDKIDVAVHQFEYNIERDAKYLYGKVGYTTFPLYLIVQEDNDEIKSVEDLAGKKVVSTSTTGNSYYVINKWNEDHGKPFEIVFQTSTALALDDMATGAADAMVTMARNAENYKTEYNAKIKTVGEPISNSNAYYLFNKESGAQLQALLDGELQKLKDDGTLIKLSIEWLGGDFIAKD